MSIINHFLPQIWGLAKKLADLEQLILLNSAPCISPPPPVSSGLAWTCSSHGNQSKPWCSSPFQYSALISAAKASHTTELSEWQATHPIYSRKDVGRVQNAANGARQSVCSPSDGFSVVWSSADSAEFVNMWIYYASWSIFKAYFLFKDSRLSSIPTNYIF